MKIKNGFILKEIAGNYVVVPVGDDLVDFSLMITLNETGAFLWDCLKEDKTQEELVALLKTEYEGATDEEIKSDVEQFVSLLKENKVLE